MFTNDPYPDPDESKLHPQTYFFLRSILILSSHICLGLPNSLFLSHFPTKMYTFVIAPMHATWPAHLIFLNFIILIIFREAQVMKLLTVQPLPASCHSLHIFGPNIQHLVLKHPQSLLYIFPHLVS